MQVGRRSQPHKTVCQIAVRYLAPILALLLQPNLLLKEKSARLKRQSILLKPTQGVLAARLPKGHFRLLKCPVRLLTRHSHLLTRQTAQHQYLKSRAHHLNRLVNPDVSSLPPRFRQIQSPWQGDAQERRQRIFKYHNQNLICPCTQTKEWGRV